MNRAQEVVLDLIAEAMLKEVAKGSKGFLIDGYPRQVQQGMQFEQEVHLCFFCSSEHYNLHRFCRAPPLSTSTWPTIPWCNVCCIAPRRAAVLTTMRCIFSLCLPCPIDAISQETIKKRLKTFNEQTTPVVDYYQKAGKLVQVEAEGTIEAVFGQLKPHMDKLTAAK